MSKLIYVADDEINIRNIIESFLLRDGHRVATFEDGDSLYETFLTAPCDLVVLDVVMPGSSGFVICTKIREISKVPIIMLTARDTDEDYESGIFLGSDDYLTKPFRPVRLSMRIKAIFRRIEMELENKQNEDEVLAFSDIRLYPKKRTSYCNQSALSLTNTEFMFLSHLIINKNKAVSKDELLSVVWGYDRIVETRATDDTVKRLRRKLAQAGSKTSIETVYGFGFRVGSNDEGVYK